MQLSLDEIESDCRDQVPSICFEVGVGGPVVNKARMVRRHVVNKRRWERETACREGYDDELSSPPDAKLGYFRLSLSLPLYLFWRGIEGERKARVNTKWTRQLRNLKQLK